MQQSNEALKILGGMPFGALVAIVLLAGFALAAYAIYAIVTISKERR
jgi:hypothetical protein